MLGGWGRAGLSAVLTNLFRTGSVCRGQEKRGQGLPPRQQRVVLRILLAAQRVEGRAWLPWEYVFIAERPRLAEICFGGRTKALDPFRAEGAANDYGAVPLIRRAVGVGDPASGAGLLSGLASHRRA